MSTLNRIIVIIVGTVIASLIVAYITGAWRPSFQTTTQPLSPATTTTQPVTPPATEQTTIDITNISIDNALLTSLYGQSIGLALVKYDDAKLQSFSFVYHPYPYPSNYSIFFNFYSAWADRICEYSSYNGGTVQISELWPDVQANNDLERVTFEELPWLQNPDWLRFLRKSSQKVGPLSPLGTTYYVVATEAYEKRWSVTFYDGASGNNYRFTWNGEGDPIQQ
jgi:hypothetical protein